MRITVTTTSTDIETLLGDKINRVNQNVQVLEHIVSIQNLGTTDIYADYLGEATKEEWFLIPPMNQVNFEANDTEQFYLVSDSADNDNVRVVIS